LHEPKQNRYGGAGAPPYLCINRGANYSVEALALHSSAHGDASSHFTA
jgi:hypothetical protein